ncbi:MAG: LAGLIDADG family homing endonuclease [Candidatus Paceibacterota bacterium]
MVDLRLIPKKDLWYSVGFITADGSLSISGRHIALTSKDRDVLDKIKRILKVSNKIGRKARGYSLEKKYFVLQIGSVDFYRFLLRIGLMQRKSKKLGSLKIPRKHFHDFLRGLIDGDGNIHTWVHPGNGNVQWSLRIYSAAPHFIEWLRFSIQEHFDLTGVISVVQKGKDVWVLKFGKFAAQRILRVCYYSGCVAMARKLKKAKLCINSKNKLNSYGGVKAIH